jgi:hypothetical protein
MRWLVWLVIGGCHATTTTGAPDAGADQAIPADDLALSNSDLAAAKGDLRTNPDLTPPPQLGLVVLYSDQAFDVKFDGGIDESRAARATIVALFDTVVTTGTQPSYSCTTAAMGACTSSVCTPPDHFDLGFSSVVTHHSAGTLQLMGGAFPISLAPGSDNSYSAAPSPQPLWAGGETLTVVAAGADVPAFSATLTAPSPVVLSTPLHDPGTLTVDRTLDLAFAWSGGGAGTFTVTLNGPNFSNVVCSFAASLGSGVMPAALLGRLPMGTGNISGSVSTRVTVPAGTAWAIEYSASTEPMQVNGVSFGGDVQLQ